MTESIEVARRLYAEQMRSLTHMSSQTLFDAFATVPRESFVGPGPWRLMAEGEYWITEDADPRHLYQNVLVTLDETKGINNGQPSLWALFLDRLDVRKNDRLLHLGCGTGYYTAILAEVVGPEGRITAVEIDEAMAKRACLALAPWPQVHVTRGDGSRGPFEPVDVIVVSAGATQPLPAWLAALKTGGRLLFPLTPDKGPGAMVHVIRTSDAAFEARLDYGAQFIPFSGARDPAASRRLARALSHDRGAGVKSLRCDPHQIDGSCWLHGEGWCFSTRGPEQSEPGIP